MVNWLLVAWSVVGCCYVIAGQLSGCCWFVGTLLVVVGQVVAWLLLVVGCCWLSLFESLMLVVGWMLGRLSKLLVIICMLLIARRLIIVGCRCVVRLLFFTAIDIGIACFYHVL